MPRSALSFYYEYDKDVYPILGVDKAAGVITPKLFGTWRCK
jgi:hypothetical protein